MSRNAIAASERPRQRYTEADVPGELKSERMTFSATPNVRGLDAAAARIVELFGVSVTRSFVKFHTEQSKKLAYHKIGGNRYYSDRDLFDLIHIGTRPNCADNGGL